MSINILEITNNTGDLNKAFTYTDNVCHKTSNAQVYDANFVEKSFDTIEAFDSYLTEDLKSNQAICLGKSKHGLSSGKLLTKGKEDVSQGFISRSNDYMTLQDEIQPCLGDVDVDEQMPQEMIEKISTADGAYDAVVMLHGDDFKDVSVRNGESSSAGITDALTEALVYMTNSRHLYWTLLNANSSQELDRYIEFLKRRAVLTNLWFLKIHKDGSTSFRTVLDLSVIKSMNSRLVFEAPVTLAEGLKKVKTPSRLYNTENCTVPFDIEKLEYKNLPDWRVVFEQAKKDKKAEIEDVKKQYRADKILELVESYGLTQVEAVRIIDEYLSTQSISASMILKGGDGNPYRVFQFLTQDAKSWEVYDIFDYKKGLGKTYVNVHNIFDAKIYTYLRGGVTYSISFTLDEIVYLLNKLDYKKDLTKILFSLVDYVVANEFKDDAIETIVQTLEDNHSTFEFEKFYYKNYIDFQVAKKMEDFAFIMMDSKTGIFRKSEDGDLTLYSVKSISDLFLNKNFHSKDPYNLKKKIMIDVVKHWMRSQGREDFTSVIFTDKETKEEEYNLFRGFAYEPINHPDVDLEPYFTLVKDVIANGNELFNNVNHAFIAQMIQDPFNKLGTALVLSGKKRIGKGTFVKIIGELIGGNHYFQTNQPDKVFGRFNIQLLRTILVYLNEAFWSGDKSMEGRIKGIITDDDFSYEIKGGAIFGAKNVTRLILDSNEKYIVPATEDEGRYIVEGISDCKKGDKEFFTSVNNLRTSQKAMEKLMYFYLNFDYKPFEHYLREAPKSKHLVEQIMQNFSKIQEWWYRNLQEGNIYKTSYVMDANGIKIANEALWDSFKEFHKGKTQYEKQISFYSDLKDLLSDGVIVKNGVKVSAGVTGKVIAPLSKARELFTQKYLVSDFDDRIDWTQPFGLDIPHPVAYSA